MIGDLQLLGFKAISPMITKNPNTTTLIVHIIKNNNILFILDVSDLSMGICKETAVIRQLFMILFAF
jgi:hypothetical protein